MMPEGPDLRETIPAQPDVGVVRRVGRRILNVFPGFRQRGAATAENEAPVHAEVPDQIELEEEQAPLGELQDYTVAVTFVDGLNKFEFTGDDNKALYPPVIISRRSAGRLHNRLAKMYLSVETGEHSGSAIAGLLAVQEATVLNDVRQLGAVLPKEILNFEKTSEGDLRLWLGNMSLAVRKPDEQDIAELDRGKVDLTTADHAIITKGKSRYYVPFETNESILAVRVVQALQSFNKVSAETENIANAVWQNMTIAERCLFVSDPVYAFSETEQVKEEILSILRKLTNRLMLTLEPTGEKFTVHNEDLVVEFFDTPVDVRDYPDARPVLPSGQDVFVELLPGKIGTAREILQAVREGKHLEDEEAVRILDFVMSATGRRALAEVFEPVVGTETHAEALKAIHKFLKLNLREAYRGARKDRTVSGNRIIRSGRAVRQVSGSMPTTTKWHIGRPLGEAFEK